jgi:hypothetical protein
VLVRDRIEADRIHRSRTSTLDKERLQGLRDELLLVEGAGAGSVDPSVLQSARPPGIHDDLLACAQLARCVFDGLSTVCP